VEETPVNIESAFPIIEILQTEGYQARIAGGAVRDHLMGIEPKDIDIATTAHPTKVMAIFETRGFTVIPTGLQHGTITVVHNHIPFEITTLRLDRETDGRHAVVEFTDDWVADAHRRDFTINAMFMDTCGNVYDYFKGQQHIKEKKIKFVGNARLRIKEDYLRILRFFRFLGRFDGTFSQNTAKSVEKYAERLNRISKERILMEIEKIVNQNHPRSLYVMNLLGVSKAIFGKDLNLETRRYVETDFPEYSATLFTMGISSDWLVENKAKRVDIMKVKFLETFTPENLNHDTFIHGRDDIELFNVTFNKGWNVPFPPKFPVNGNDVAEKFGVNGADLGKKMRELHREWAVNNFKLEI
jgi:tRNA nucleotidyltransferase (CCA-adding enzyme)